MLPLSSLIKKTIWLAIVVGLLGPNIHAASNSTRWTGIWLIDGLEIDSDWGKSFTANNWKRSIQIQHVGGVTYQVGAVGSSDYFTVTESGDDLVLSGRNIDSENPDVMVDERFRLHWVADDWAVFVQSHIGLDAQTLTDTYYSSFNIGVVNRTPMTEPLRPWEGTYSASELNIESLDGKDGISIYILNPTITLAKIDSLHYRPSLILGELNPAYDVSTVKGNYLEANITTETNGIIVRRFDRCFQLPAGRICTITGESHFATNNGQPLTYTGCYTTIGQYVPKSELAITRQEGNLNLSILNGMPGLNYAVQYRGQVDGGLAPWITLTNTVLTNSSFLFQDVFNNSLPARFYHLAIDVPATAPFK